MKLRKRTTHSYSNARILVYAIPMGDATSIILGIMSSPALTDSRKQFLATLVAHRTEIRQESQRQELRILAKEMGFRY